MGDTIFPSIFGMGIATMFSSVFGVGTPIFLGYLVWGGHMYQPRGAPNFLVGYQIYQEIWCGDTEFPGIPNNL